MMLPEKSSREQSVLPVSGEERSPRPHIWIAVDSDLRKGRQSQTHSTSLTSNPLARASTEISTRMALSGFLYSLSSAMRSPSGVLDVKTAARMPASLNCRQISSQWAIVAPKTMVLRELARLHHSVTTSPMISMPRSSAALSVHSPPDVAAPRMSGCVHEKTRIGTSTPDSVSSCMVAALTRLVKIFPRPVENGVADSPTTWASVCWTCSVHAEYWVCASSTTITSASGHPRRARVWQLAIWCNLSLIPAMKNLLALMLIWALSISMNFLAIFQKLRMSFLDTFIKDELPLRLITFFTMRDLLDILTNGKWSMN